jgi:hypothetical protein
MVSVLRKKIKKENRLRTINEERIVKRKKDQEISRSRNPGIAFREKQEANQGETGLEALLLNLKKGRVIRRYSSRSRKSTNLSNELKLFLGKTTKS